MQLLLDQRFFHSPHVKVVLSRRLPRARHMQQGVRQKSFENLQGLWTYTLLGLHSYYWVSFEEKALPEL